MRCERSLGGFWLTSWPNGSCLHLCATAGGSGSRWSFFVVMQVVTQTNEEVFFKIKRNTKLSKLQGAYANKVGKDVSSIR